MTKTETDLLIELKKNEELDITNKIIRDLVTGLEILSAETDGIPDFLWEQYKAAKSFIGEELLISKTDFTD